MVRIRLRRMGLRNRPTYRIVVIDSRKSRDGKYIESLGHYDPRTKQLDINRDQYKEWLTKGAQPSNTVSRLHARLQKTQVVVAAPAEPVAPEPLPAADDPTLVDTPAAGAADQGATL